MFSKIYFECKKSYDTNRDKNTDLSHEKNEILLFRYVHAI